MASSLRVVFLFQPRNYWPKILLDKLLPSIASRYVFVLTEVATYYPHNKNSYWITNRLTKYQTARMRDNVIDVRR